MSTDVLVGTWTSADQTQIFPVYLEMIDIVFGDNGGRCKLTSEEYERLEHKIRMFRRAVLDQDTKYLNKEFNFKLPQSIEWRDLIKKSIPHNIFCNWQGYMLGNGVVWFNASGRIIAVNYLHRKRNKG